MKRTCNTQLALLKTQVKHNTLHKITARGALGRKMVVNRRRKKKSLRITWVKTTHWFFLTATFHRKLSSRANNQEGCVHGRPSDDGRLKKSLLFSFVSVVLLPGGNEDKTKPPTTFCEDKHLGHFIVWYKRWQAKAQSRGATVWLMGKYVAT